MRKLAPDVNSKTGTACGRKHRHVLTIVLCHWQYWYSVFKGKVSMVVSPQAQHTLDWPPTAKEHTHSPATLESLWQHITTCASRKQLSLFRLIAKQMPGGEILFLSGSSVWLRINKGWYYNKYSQCVNLHFPCINSTSAWFVLLLSTMWRRKMALIIELMQQ